MEMFCRRFVNLLQNTHIQYFGDSIVPDVDNNLAELIEDPLDLRLVDREKSNKPLQEMLIKTLVVADYHFKLEKDYREESPNLALKVLNKLRRSNDESPYQELGGLLSEANGITLERGFAEAFEKLLKDYQIVRPAKKFQDTAYPYLNTLALEAATDKIHNPAYNLLLR